MESGCTTIPEGTPTDNAACRPATSKPRGICKYYNTDRGCYAGDRCKFLHGETERLTPYDKHKVCRFFAAGYCKHGEKCWFLHVEPIQASSTTQAAEEDEHLCSICYDKPSTFGLLAGCSHVFCISCIKNWRESQGKSEDIVQAGTTKTCPMCRAVSRFVTPSAFFYAEGDSRKAEMIEKYKASMSRVKCRNFERSKPHARFCPFGNECFYKHENADGTPYVFEHGAAYYMEHGRPRRFRGLDNDTWSIDVEEHVEFMLNTISQVFGTSREMQRAILESVAAEFGDESLPSMYRLDEQDEDDDLTVPPVPPTESVDGGERTGDESSLPSAPEASPSAHGELTSDVSAEEDGSIASASGHSGVASAGPSTPTTHLDPTTPAFVPSFQRSSAQQDAGSSQELDWLRPLPPGPAVVGGTREDGDLGSSEVASESRRSSPSMSIDELLRQIDGITARRLEEPSSPPVASFDVSTLLLNPASDPATQPASPSIHAASSTDAQSSVPEPALVQDADPPFMTDGRGRVVWSSTTSSRGREGRRGRAASSSATVLPHSKPTPDAPVPEESCTSVSRHDSPAQRTFSLTRRLSLPSVGPSSDVEEPEAPPAEFVTDGRGRVVFAANNHDH